MTPEFFTALKLICLLDQSFPGTSSLIVGGAVRDRLLDIPSKDVDIATNIPFNLLKESLFDLTDITKNTLNPQPVSIINFCGQSFEIAAFRSDSRGVEGKANNLATVVDTFDEDAERRDITINAMGINSLDTVVDPLGGKADLQARLIRCVGDPAERFKEDATRILRVFRFAAKFNFDIEAQTLLSATENKWRLLDRNQISPESIAKEIYKAAGLGGAAFANFICLLDSAGILKHILPEFTVLHGFTHDPQHHPEGGSTVIGHILECLRVSQSYNPVAILAILFHDLGKATTRDVKENGHSNYHGHEEAGVAIVEGIFDRLRFNDLSAADKENIIFTTRRHMLIHKLREISPNKLTQLVLNPGWELLKEVGFADEFSRGSDVYCNFESFYEKIEWAESRVANIASSTDDLRLKVKAYIDGHKVQSWFPETKADPKLLKPILSGVAEYILECVDLGCPPSETTIKNKISDILFLLP